MGGLFAQYSNTSSGVNAGIGILFFLLAVAIYLFFGYCFGRIFQKAGRPLWEGFVPIYSVYVMLKIVGRPGWWLILYIIPIVNIVITIIVYYDLARSFGKGVGFTLGLFFLWFIFIPILALSDAQYVGPAAGGGPPGGYPPPGYPPAGYPPPPGAPTRGGWDAPR
jgi:hypothetical protein